jgi:sugar phosphate isomerase/epimerase
MNIGLLTDCLAEVSLPETARWAAQAAFGALDVPCARRGESWYDGAMLVAGKVDDGAARRLEEVLAAGGLQISALDCRRNMLEPDEAARQAHWTLLADVVRLATLVRAPVVVCHVGRDPGQRIGECIAQWARLAEDIVHLAAEHGVRLAVENSPQCGPHNSHLEDMPGNLAFAPELWEKLFTHVRSETVGLCYNPGHLHWLGVDPVETVTAYAERIYHVRATDAEVFRDRLSDCSVLRPGGGWWRYRLPGLGEINWRRLIDRLQENGYDGTVSVAHDDPVWTGSQERVKRGLEQSRGFLARYIV